MFDFDAAVEICGVNFARQNFCAAVMAIVIEEIESAPRRPVDQSPVGSAPQLNRIRTAHDQIILNRQIDIRRPQDAGTKQPNR